MIETIKKNIVELETMRNDMYDLLDNMNDNINELREEFSYIGDNDFIEIDDLIIRLSDERLLTEELEDFLVKLKYRRK